MSDLLSRFERWAAKPKVGSINEQQRWESFARELAEFGRRQQTVIAEASEFAVAMGSDAESSELLAILDPQSADLDPDEERAERFHANDTEADYYFGPSTSDAGAS